jgi:hypothetical protein
VEIEQSRQHLSSTPDANLGVDRTQVIFNRSYTDTKALPRARVIESLGNYPDHIHFACRQPKPLPPSVQTRGLAVKNSQTRVRDHGSADQSGHIGDWRHQIEHFLLYEIAQHGLQRGYKVLYEGELSSLKALGAAAALEAQGEDLRTEIGSDGECDPERFMYVVPEQELTEALAARRSGHVQ